ncbi:MAG: hypothetical protein ABI311_04080, partial [Gemmatimonadaceae bacterium]
PRNRYSHGVNLYDISACNTRYDLAAALYFAAMSLRRETAVAFSGFAISIGGMMNRCVSPFMDCATALEWTWPGEEDARFYAVVDAAMERLKILEGWFEAPYYAVGSYMSRLHCLAGLDDAEPRKKKRGRPRQARPLLQHAKSPGRIREIVEHALKFDTPLLRRLSVQENESTVLAYAMRGAETSYVLSVASDIGARAPRRAHFEWFRAHADETRTPALLVADRELADYVDAYFHKYGRPRDCTQHNIESWLDEEISLSATDMPADVALGQSRRYSYVYRRLVRAVNQCSEFGAWYNPSTQEPIGRLTPRCPSSLSVIRATTPAALTCFQWTCDILKLGIRVDVV